MDIQSIGFLLSFSAEIRKLVKPEATSTPAIADNQSTDTDTISPAVNNEP
ncbi:hypothetical protein K3T99_004646 [Salmonella enterica subsp. enterica serovar Kedougou]|nr:hypothetical protein [Salmonella enterica subsp. enterica serovar Kedougou]